jgi:iron(III) transport system substrate-binding protein
MKKPKLSRRAGREPLADIKLMQENAEGAEKQSEDIKARYQKLFHV